MSGPNAQFALTGKRVYVAGHTGMVGSAIVRRLEGEGCKILAAKRPDFDLRRPEQIDRWMADAKPDAVFLAPGRSVAYMPTARTQQILSRTIWRSRLTSSELLMKRGVQKLLFLGSFCMQKLLFLGSSRIFPRLAPQPITEETLLTGPLEPTNQW